MEFLELYYDFSEISTSIPARPGERICCTK